MHIGLHKTGSTFMQSIASRNQMRLIASDLYFRRQTGYPAHHDQAWRLLRGDFSGVDKMVQEATVTGARDLLISSEDLESLLFRPDLAAALAARLREAGYDHVAFAMFLRNPAESFWSLYAEISKHIYIDPIAMFCDAMRLGYVYVERPSSIYVKPPYWYFSFDHEQNVARFHEAMSATAGANRYSLRLYDFHEDDGFLGRRFFADLGVLGAISQMPSRADRNERQGAATVQANYVGHVLSQLSTRAGDVLNDSLVQRTAFTAEQRAHIANAIETRYRRGAARLLDRFREPPPGRHAAAADHVT